MYTQKHNLNRYILLGVLFISILGGYSLTFPPDSMEYPLSDPRNPNCPCHTHQKLADEEYKEYLASINKTKKILDDSNKEKNVLESFNKTSKRKRNRIGKISIRSSSFKYKCARNKKKHFQFLRKKKSMDDCFRWK